MPVCEIHGCTEHYACRLRAKNVGLSQAITPTRSSVRDQPLRPMVEPSWEKGIAGERRCDGSFMPYLNDHREVMGVHELAEKRQDVEAAVTRLKTDPNVFARERATAAGGS